MKVYLDHHATTPCDPRVVEEMLPYFSETFGNAASRSHAWGYAAKSAVEHARARMGARIGCSPKEVLWTSGATESNNIAILGTARANADRGRHVLTVATAHKAVLDPCKQLEKEGFEVTVFTPRADGRIEPRALAGAMRGDTILVSVMAVNNEVGTIQPIAELGTLCRDHGAVFHCDAAQALSTQSINVRTWDVDLMSLSAHKAYGPKGVGALFVRRGRPKVRIEPVIFGGGHERGLRSGTLAVPLIVGMGKAVTLFDPDEVERIRRLRDRLWAGLQQLDGVRLYGSLEHRHPGNLNVGFEGVEAEAFLMGLGDIALSSGSACTSATLEPSHVLQALGVPREQAARAIRFGIGRPNTEAEIDLVIDQVCAKVTELRALATLLED